MNLINLLQVNVYPSQYCVVIPRTDRIVYYQYFYAPCVKPADSDYVLIKDWTRDDFCKIMFPDIGVYTLAVAVSPEKQYTDPAMFSTITVNISEQLEQTVEFITEWNELDNHFWKIVCNCRHMKHAHMKLIQYILKKMYCENFTKKLPICELNNVFGCTGHPDGTHTTGTDIDFNYYCLGGDNLTQEYGIGYPDKIFTDGQVDADKFDWFNTAILWSMLFDHFQDCQIRTDERIKEFIFNATGEFANVVGDDPGMYKHDTHFHVSLGNTLIW